MKVKAIAIAHDGKAVCRNDQNEVSFIAGLIPGEIAEVDSDQIVEIIEHSPDRITPPCPYFQNCGGCNLQYLKIERQRSEKLLLLKHTLEKYFKVNFQEYLDCSKDLPEYHYRNRVSFQRSNSQTGFFKKKSNQLVEVKECLLLDQKLNNYFKDQEYFNNLPAKVEGVNLALWEGQVYQQNKTPGPIEHQQTIPVGHFLQVNSLGNQRLIEIVLKEIKFSQVTEFYAGAGNFTFPLAVQGKQVIAVEADRKLVNFARQQLTDQHKIEFICTTVEKFIKSGIPRGAVLLDPPRNGASELVQKLNPKNQPELIYVSCNPRTLGRDSQVLVKNGYQARQIYFVDMFPQTEHLETLAIFRQP